MAEPSLRIADARMPDGLPVASCDIPVGGQAVLEGVMMRGVSTWALAVKKPDGAVEVTSEPVVDVNVTASNCVQCGAITAKGGRLTLPEGGDGPLYQET